MADDERFLPPKRPDRKPGQEPTARLTLDAYVRLRKELDRMKTEGREYIAERLLRARELGDLRENAEYDAAKNEQGLMEAKIRDLDHQLKDPEILETGSGDEVGPGIIVTLLPKGEDEPEEESYLVAHHPEERAAGVRTITSISPLGSVLMGRRVGDEVTYQAPGGTFTYQVVSLRPHVPG